MTDQPNVPAIVPASQPEIEEPYALLRLGDISGLLDTLRDNVGAAGIQTLDLPRIRVTPGGSTHWVIATLEGEESAKNVEGVILGWRPYRIYWKRAMKEGGGKLPPDCTSEDGVVGIGDPGGVCATCSFSKFGSSQKGKGQACKQIRQLLLVRPYEVLPCLLSVPPTSLKPCQQYFMTLFSRGIPYWGVVTRIGLEKATNEDGMPYSKMTFSGGRILTSAERTILAPFHNQMQDMLVPGVIDARDYTIEEDNQAS
jgi:hypothetical protein